MKLRIDPITLKKFQEENVTDVAITFITAGCAGNKVNLQSIQPEDAQSQGLLGYQQDQGPQIWIASQYADKLDGMQIAIAKGKTYLVGSQVQSRCGCGTSFSFEKKNIDLSMKKIHMLAEKLGNISNIRAALKGKKK